MAKNFFLLIIISLIFAVSCGDDCQFESIVTDSLPNAKLNTVYSAKIEQQSTCSYTAKKCELLSGSLPKGINLGGDGVLSGKPENLGTYTFIVKYEVCFGSSAYGATNCTEKSKQFIIVVEE